MKRRVKIQSGNPHPLGPPITPNTEILNAFNGERSVADAYKFHCARGDRVRVQRFERLMQETIAKGQRPEL